MKGEERGREERGRREGGRREERGREERGREEGEREERGREERGRREGGEREGGEREERERREGGRREEGREGGRREITGSIYHIKITSLVFDLLDYLLILALNGNLRLQYLAPQFLLALHSLCQLCLKLHLLTSKPCPLGLPLCLLL